MCESGFSVMWSVGLRVFKTSFSTITKVIRGIRQGILASFVQLYTVSVPDPYSVIFGPPLEASEKRDWGATVKACVLMKIANKRVINSVSVQMPSHWHSSVHLSVSVFERGVSLGPLRSPGCRCLCVLTMCVSLFKCQKYTLQESQQNFVTIWCSMNCAFQICFSCIIINNKGKYISSVSSYSNIGY